MYNKFFLNPLYFYVTSSNSLLSMDYLILFPQPPFLLAGKGHVYISNMKEELADFSLIPSVALVFSIQSNVFI